MSRYITSTPGIYSPWRKDFPAIAHQGVYLDSAATTHKPEQVIRAVAELYKTSYAPVHRGIYPAAEALTERFEEVRTKVAHFMGVGSAHQIVLTHGATDAMHTFMRAWAVHNVNLRTGDEVVFTELDHHMVAASWRACAQELGIMYRVLPVRDSSCWLDLNALLNTTITRSTRVVTIPLSSNIRGPLSSRELSCIVSAARAVGAIVIADASQVPAHQEVAPLIKKYNFDVVIWSGHKCFAPSGVGVLFIAEHLHHELHPCQYGGGMVHELSSSRFLYKPMPYLLEAGTRPIEAIIGLGAALEYIEQHVAYHDLRIHEAALVQAALDHLDTVAGLSILGDNNFLRSNGHMVTCAVEGVNAHDIAWYLAQQNIAVRAGHHCCQPLHDKLGISGSVRLSFALYNDLSDVHRTCSTIAEAVRILRS